MATVQDRQASTERYSGISAEDDIANTILILIDKCDRIVCKRFWLPVLPIGTACKAIPTPTLTRMSFIDPHPRQSEPRPVC